MDDPYSILNLYPDCTYDEARAAYKKAALMHHPDRHPPSRKAEAERRFRILANAFQQVCFELGHPIEPPELGKKSESGGVPQARSSGKTADRSAKLNNKNGDEEKDEPSSVSVTAASRSSNTQSSKVPTSTNQSQISSSTKPSDRRLLTGKQPLPRSDVFRVAGLDEVDDSQLYDDVIPPPNLNKSHRSNIAPPPVDRRDASGPLARRSSRGGPSIDGNSSYADYPVNSRSNPPLTRRSSISSHPAELGGYGRGLLDTGRSEHQSANRNPQYDEGRNGLYDLKPSRRDNYGRDDDWDLGLGIGSDDFFGGSGRRKDPFGAGSSMISDIGMGFDNMMASAFKGMSMAGPDPNELMQMDSGSCTMRVRQSKMVMGRTDDGSWAGKKMEKQMKMGNGRMEVSENAQDIRMGSRNPGGSRCPPGAGSGRSGNREYWDPPPAYEGGVGNDPEDVGDYYERDRPREYNGGANSQRYPSHRQVTDTFEPDPRLISEGRMTMGASGPPESARAPGPLYRPSKDYGGGDYGSDPRESRFDYGAPRAGRSGRSSSVSGRSQVLPPDNYNHSMVRRPNGHLARS